MPENYLRVTWQARDGAPVFPFDPGEPDGTNLDLSLGAERTCWTPLPYPGSGVGVHVVECPRCGLCVRCAAAGRADDPHTLTVACRPLAERRAAA